MLFWRCVFSNHRRVSTPIPALARLDWCHKVLRDAYLARYALNHDYIFDIIEVRVMAWARWFVFGCLILSFAGCTCSRSAQDTIAEETIADTSIPDPNKAPDYSGISVERVITNDLDAGEGDEIKEGSKVSGYYGMWVYAPAMLANKGKLISGTPEDRSKMFTFKVGKGEVVKGWEQGVLGMRAGGKRSIIVPVSLGYGEGGTENVPPGSIILIEFEAASVN